MSFSITPALGGNSSQSNGPNGYGQSRSHHRKAAPERIPVVQDSRVTPYTLDSPFDSQQKTSINGLRGSHRQNKSMVEHNGYPAANRSSTSTSNHSAEGGYMGPQMDSKVDSQSRLAFSKSNGYTLSDTQVGLGLRPGAVSYRQTLLAPGVVTSILIPLPFVLSSLVLTSQLTPLGAERGNDVELLVNTKLTGVITPRSPSRFLSFLGVCSLTAATLVLVGFIGEIFGHTNSTFSVQSEAKPSSEAVLSVSTARRIIGRILSIGLPFYAASKLGGERIAIGILVAITAELMSINPKVEEISRPGSWSQLVVSRKWTVITLALQCLADLLNLTNNSLPLQISSGYLALGVSVLLLPWPYPTTASKTAMINSPRADRSSKPAVIMASPQDPSTPYLKGLATARSPMIATSRDTDLTVASGVIATVISFIVFVFSSQQTQTLTLGLLLGGSIVAIASAVSLLFANPRTLTSRKGLTLATGLSVSIAIQELIDSHPLLPLLFQCMLTVFAWLGVNFDTKNSSSGPDHQVHSSQSHSHEETTSRLTTTLLRLTQDWPLLHSILLEKDSRRILYFMSLNFAFMLVQTFYGWATGSLGLLSDSVHMFFDCAALLVGLGAAVLSKRPPSLRFPYGFEKMDTLAGFANGIFLMLISVEIVYEALERLIEGSHMQRLGELLVVSALGLAVNLVGMFAFGHAHHGHGHGHGHSHDHGGHEHSHSHEASHNSHHTHHHDHSHEHGHSHKDSHNSALPLPSPTPSPFPIGTPTAPAIMVTDSHTQSHSHGHGHDHDHDHHAHGHHHGHSHGHENMEGIFLHVLADTLGSVAVVISTILVHFTGWVGWDPIASCMIAILIFASAIPLVRSCAKNLLLVVPEGTEFDLREALAGVSGLRGVVNVCAPRIWVSSGEKAQVEGVMHVIASKGADSEDVRERASAYLAGKGMSVLVQVERDGEGRCWCGGVTKT